jgi:hypothetical protein
MEHRRVALIEGAAAAGAQAVEDVLQAAALVGAILAVAVGLAPGV